MVPLQVTQVMDAAGSEFAVSVGVADRNKPQIEALKRCGCRLVGEQVGKHQNLQYIACPQGKYAARLSDTPDEVDAATLDLVHNFDAKQFRTWHKRQPPDPILRPAPTHRPRWSFLPYLEPRGRGGLGFWILPGWFGLQIWRLKLTIARTHIGHQR